jgi:hypothetical protein
MVRPIDDLLSDLGTELNIADPNRYRVTLLRQLRIICRRIGFSVVGRVRTEDFPVGGFQVQLPDSLLKIESVVWTDGMERTYLSRQKLNTETITYSPTTEGIEVYDQPDGTVRIKYISLPVDDRGHALIRDEIYDAVFKQFLGAVLNTLPLHPRYAERGLIQSEAERLVAEATVELVEGNEDSDRLLRHALGGLKSSNQENQ